MVWNWLCSFKALEEENKGLKGQGQGVEEIRRDYKEMERAYTQVCGLVCRCSMRSMNSKRKSKGLNTITVRIASTSNNLNLLSSRVKITRTL